MSDERLARPLDGAVLARLADARPLLALFDIDGTLAPLAPRPQDASVPDSARRALARLAAARDVRVGVVTGRSAGDGARMVRLPGIWVVGNHGVETCDPDGTRHVAPAMLPFAEPLARAVDALMAPVAAAPGAILEDKRWSLTVHWRLADPAHVPALAAAVHAVAEREGLRVGEGKMVFELKGTADVDKGTASVALAQRLGALGPRGAVLYVGDDRTDEDAFRRLRVASDRAITIRVGAPDQPTRAEWRVDAPTDVHRFLDELAGRRAGAAPAA
ncbi:MAG: trehalose-phosphatase [Gemmatirosa sp.]